MDMLDEQVNIQRDRYRVRGRDMIGGYAENYDYGDADGDADTEE